MDPRLLGSGGQLDANGNPVQPANGAPNMGMSNAAMAYGAPAPAQGQGTPALGGAQQIGLPQNAGGYNPYDNVQPGQVVTDQGTTPFFGGAGWGSQVQGQMGANQTFAQAEQMNNQKWSIANDVNYADYQNKSNQSNAWGGQGVGVLNDPRQAQALANENKLATGSTQGQQAALSAQTQGLGILHNAAEGNGPTAAGIQQQQGISAAMHAQLTAASSARGGAYAQAAAQQGAQQQAAGLQAGSVGQAAQLRAQEMQAAQGQYAGAAGQFASAQNQAAGLQGQAASAYQQGVQGAQGQALNYYQQQQQAYQHQADQAAGLASNQTANNYGLSGTQLQTQTQQNIANQQQTGQEVGAAVGAGAMLLAAASTGGAQAAAKGAREHGASEIEAARIGLHVGQALGMARLGPAAQHYAGADAAAARKGAMTPAEMHAHIAKLRDNGKAVRRLPGPATEPMAAHAYAAGSHLAALAKMHGRSAHA